MLRYLLVWCCWRTQYYTSADFTNEDPDCVIIFDELAMVILQKGNGAM